VATAAGVARASGRGATLLIGDLALLHDLNSLALLGDMPERLVVIVVNNDGGGIFGQLPIAAFGANEHADPFERLFGTPHGMTFNAAARQFRLNYSAPDSLWAFADAYRDAIARDTSTLIELRTDRTDDARARLLTDAERAVASTGRF
jgi:2-succinyl-5-enolpyruvyl-6-hydroxy-3-cyclohexene-1-carboxylate synthase